MGPMEANFASEGLSETTAVGDSRVVRKLRTSADSDAVSTRMLMRRRDLVSQCSSLQLLLLFAIIGNPTNV